MKLQPLLEGGMEPQSPSHDAAALQAYEAFLGSKVKLADGDGLPCDASEVHPLLKPHQRDIVMWAVRGGRRAVFAAFGLGKSVIQLEIVRLVLQKATGSMGKGLIVCPLGVRQEFARDAGMLGLTTMFIRSHTEATAPGIYLTNYESVRDGKLDPREFTVVSLDEAAVLRGFGATKTFREFMRFYEGSARYRFVATATPSPNDYIELLAYAAFLDIMDVGQAKTRFFKRDSTQADQLTLRDHQAKEFWLWVSSWAIFVQKPSDLCRCTCHARNYTANGSDASSQSHGSAEAAGTMESGVAAATAVERTSPRQLISCQDECSVVDVSARSMAGNTAAPTESGKASLGAVLDEPTRTGLTTEAAVSPSASVGVSSPTSSQILESHQPAPLSRDVITPATTSHPTATGQLENSRPATRDGQSSLASRAERRQSPRGLKSLASATGSCTAATGSAGQTSASSKTYCDSCRCDEGYELPPLDIRWHEVTPEHAPGTDVARSGQALMFRDASLGIQEAAREKRESLAPRVAKMRELVDEYPAEHFLLWHDLEAERHAICAAVPDAAAVWGSQDLDEREALIVRFSDGLEQYLATKPVIAGSGCNFQRHCHRAIFVGIGFKFADFIQAIHRVYRFLQVHQVRIDLIYTEAEREVRKQLERKWQQHNELVATMGAIIREHGLSRSAMAASLARKVGVDRQEAAGAGWRCINNDSVVETSQMASDSVDLIVTSIPFSTQYEYTPSYNDFGHSEDNDAFWQQMDFLTPQLLRVLRPGRVAAIHVKDRIAPGGLTGLGFQTVQPFHAEAIAHYMRHGFAYLGMKTIVTDVVRENNQTYRLGYTEQCKDGTRMGCGMPEYVLLFRKPPTDSSNGYADVPVVKTKESYSLARWQLDAHGFQRSSGNRLLTAEDLDGIPHHAIYKLFRRYSLTEAYDYEQHVALTASLGQRLPVTFMLMPPHSWHPDVWTDVARMRTLNMDQERRGREQHLCPLQFDIVDRLIVQHSMEGETVYDPFGGLMTVPVRALMLKRQGIACELNPVYWRDGVNYAAAAERESSTPSLFDLTAIEDDQEVA
jgi:hypothetical protein